MTGSPVPNLASVNREMVGHYILQDTASQKAQGGVAHARSCSGRDFQHGEMGRDGKEGYYFPRLGFQEGIHGVGRCCSVGGADACIARRLWEPIVVR